MAYASAYPARARSNLRPWGRGQRAAGGGSSGRRIGACQVDAPVIFLLGWCSMVQLPRACVIGAGSSGIAGAKALPERSIPFDCFEKSDRIGGNWVFGNKNGVSSAYRSLHINTSRERMEYSDYPMPASYPDFPHHTQIAAYFNDYVDHFGFREQIIFET